jgi:hypothetical protein
LPAGSYTASISGIGGATGPALVEVLDVDKLEEASPTSRLGSISSRGIVEGGNNVVIGGFNIAGDIPKRMLVRAVGPRLEVFGVSGALADPVLTLHDQSTAEVIATNDTWTDDSTAIIEASASVQAFELADDATSAAMVIWLAPGSYTAVASSADPNTSGVALVEMYELP